MSEAEAAAAEIERLVGVGDYAGATSQSEEWLATLEQRLGRSDPELLEALGGLATLYQMQGDDAKAEPLLVRAVEIIETAIGAAQPALAGVLWQLATIYAGRGDYAKSEPLLVRGLDIVETVTSDRHPALLPFLVSLADLSRARGAYGRAGPLYRRALTIAEDTSAADMTALAPILDGLGAVCMLETKYAEAETLLRRALEHKEHAGAPPESIALTLGILGELEQARGSYVHAEELYLRSLRMLESAVGEEHVATGKTRYDLAGLYLRLGQYANAERLYMCTLAIEERSLGSSHPELAKTLQGVGELYRARGAYASAVVYLSRALKIFTADLDVAATLNSLGLVYFAQGAFADAERALSRALTLRETMLGADDPSVGTSLNNLAELYRVRKDYAKAEPLLVRALAIKETALGPHHAAVANPVNNLGLLYLDQDAYERAAGLFRRALTILEAAYRQPHPELASTINNLAVVSLKQGREAEARKLFERSLEIYERALGVDHPFVANALNNLGLLSFCVGDLRSAYSYFLRGSEARERHLSIELAAGDGPRKRALLNTLRAEREGLVSFHAHGARSDDGALALAFTTILRRKGRVLDELAGASAALRRNLSPHLQAMLDEREVHATALSAALNATTATPERNDADAIRDLRAKLDKVESALSERSALFRVQTEPAVIGRVQDALPEDAALIEFVRYQRFEPYLGTAWREERYGAFVLRREGAPGWVPLGDAESVHASIAAARTAVTDPSTDAHPALRALDALVLEPVRQLLQNVRHYILSPDGALHLVPFAALVDEHGKALVERVVVSHVMSGRDIPRLAARLEPRSAPLVLAGPDYGDGQTWPELPGALAEAQPVRAWFPEVVVRSGRQATKEELTRVTGPLFVHAATHGAFRLPQDGTSLARPPTLRAARDFAAQEAFSLPPDAEDPDTALDFSILAFAGANESASAVMTAREAALLDLGGTQLVVLSACETGLGDLAWGEGIYGLRRALGIAGAESQIVSLWRIADAATPVLMNVLYRALAAGVGRSEALQQAQLQLMHEPGFAHPFFWAAFIPTGDWRPLMQ